MTLEQGSLYAALEGTVTPIVIMYPLSCLNAPTVLSEIECYIDLVR